ncbi:PilZ domain-containing protein [Oceanidesulfovibrio indonesiensis]|nr:PilZ domain-containing protein [Oceanidesulfovibrio indonesiensis]
MGKVSVEDRRRWMRVVISESEGENLVIVNRENGEPFHARIVDFSLGGLKLLCTDSNGGKFLPCPDLARHETLYIEQCRIEPYCQLLSNLEVHVVWQVDNAVGCCFEVCDNCS